MQYIGDSDNEGLAYLLFMLMRWGSLTTQVCPKCGLVDSHRPRVAHKQWRCRNNACRHDFSLKSGSLFDGTKLPYSKLLKAMWLWSNTSKGISAVAMTRYLGIGYEAAYLLLHKFRWALFSRSLQFRFKGEVEVDVVWIFKSMRKFNFRSRKSLASFNKKRRRKYAIAAMRADRGLTRQDARKLASDAISLTERHFGENPKKRPLLSITERGPDGKVKRSIGVLLQKDESFAEVSPVVNQFVDRDTKIFTDSAPGYNGLAAKFELTQINHDAFYSLGDGQHTNNVESVFARWRRTEKGVYHRMSAPTVEWYFAENAWREEYRRTESGERFRAFLKCMLQAGLCRELKKYRGQQPGREVKPRRIELKAMELPALRAVDRFSRMGLVEDPMLMEVRALRADLEPQPISGTSMAAPRIRSWDRRGRALQL